MDKLTDTNGAKTGTTPADFGRTLLERLRRDPVPRLRIQTDDPQEDRLVLDSDSCRFDVEWNLHPDRTSHVDIFVEHRSNPVLLADWLARNLERVNSETDSELDDYTLPGATYACPQQWADTWSPQAGTEFIDWIVRCLNAFSTVPVARPIPGETDPTPEPKHHP